MVSEFDPEEILEQIGGEEELLKEMAEIFLSIYKEDLDSIEKAIESKDRENIRKSAHRMKGSVGNFGRNRAYHASKELEESSPSEDMVKLSALYKNLSRELASLDMALRKYCQVS